MSTSTTFIFLCRYILQKVSNKAFAILRGSYSNFPTRAWSPSHSYGSLLPRDLKIWKKNQLFFSSDFRTNVGGSKPGLWQIKARFPSVNSNPCSEFFSFNRPFPSSKKFHFQNEAKCETFVVEMSVICIIIKTRFHNKGFALSLVLKVKLFGTRKWPIHYSLSVKRSMRANGKSGMRWAQCRPQVWQVKGLLRITL